MITGEDLCRAKFEKSKSSDYESYKAGWYARERFGTVDSRDTAEIKLAINSELVKVESSVRRLYADFPEINKKYMGHEDPLSNIICLLNHVRNELHELAERRIAEQFMLFTGGTQ